MEIIKGYVLRFKLKPLKSFIKDKYPEVLDEFNIVEQHEAYKRLGRGSDLVSSTNSLLSAISNKISNSLFYAIQDWSISSLGKAHSVIDNIYLGELNV